MIDTDRQISGLPRGRRSLLPDTVREFATPLINTNSGMKAAESLKQVRAPFRKLSPEVTDNRIANAKSLNKSSGHEL